VWGVGVVLAVGAAALGWVVVSWLVAEPPEPPRELGLTMPGSAPGLNATRPPVWRVRVLKKKPWSKVVAGACVTAGTELELGSRSGPGLVERSDGLRIYCAPGTLLKVDLTATDESGISLVKGRALVTIPKGAERFALGLTDPPRFKPGDSLATRAVTFAGEAGTILSEVAGSVAFVTTVSGKATLSWPTGARDLVRRERLEVTATREVVNVGLVDLRALDLGFAPPELRVSPWPQVGGSAARDGLSPFKFALPPRRILDLDAGAGAAGPVIGADGTVYVLAGPAPGKLLALRGGKIAASATFEETPVGTPAVAPDGTILVAMRSGVARVSVDLARVTPVVAFEPGDMPRVGPTVTPEGDIYIVLGAGLAAYSSEGRQLWQRDDIRSSSPPSVASNGTVFIAAISGKLHALDPATGDDRTPSSTPVDEPFLAHVAVSSDGTAYAVSATRYLAWRTADGKSGRVALPVSEYVLAPAIMPSGEIVIASAGGVIHRLPPRPTEAPKQPFFEAGERIARGPVIDASGRVVVWTASGKLVAVEPSGRSRSWDLGAEDGSSAAVSRDGALLFVTGTGAFFGK
jgi:outer membrane protein assembly factor BamB